MKIFHNFDNLPAIRKPIVAIGSFDGVHRGHRLLIAQMCDLARQQDGESVAITFDPHPRQVLKGENRLLSTIGEKLELLAQTEIDNVIVVNFTIEFSRIPYQSFIEDFIIGKLHASTIIVGQGHHFGHNRAGGVEAMERYGLEIKRLERYDNISSTSIRTAIEHGKMSHAVDLLGTDSYLIHLPVKENSKLLPPEGWYNVEINGVRQRVKFDNNFTDSTSQSVLVLHEDLETI